MEPRSPNLCRTFPPSCSFFFRWLWKKLPKSHKRSHSINSVDQNGIRFAHFSLHLCCTFELPCLCGISHPIFGIYDTLPSKAYPAPSFYLHWFCVFFFLSWFSASFPFVASGVFLSTCSRFHIFFHSRCVLSFFCCPPILTYTHCASQAPERSNICVLLCSAVWWCMFCFSCVFISMCTRSQGVHEA